MKPQLVLLSKPVFTSEHSLMLDALRAEGWLQDNQATDAEQLVEFAGRICYLSFGSRQSPKSNKQYIQHLITSGHESVLEHATWTIGLSGISRAFTHQLVRHRVGMAFSQLSQQYHDESSATFIRPSELDLVPNAERIWLKAIQYSSETYKKMIDELEHELSDESHLLRGKELRRAIRSAARSILPNATETAVVLTINARAARHFLRVRGNIPGDSEMRKVCVALLDVLKPEAPAIFYDFQVEAEEDGTLSVKQKHS